MSIKVESHNADRVLPTNVELSWPGDLHRAAVERFISSCFKRIYRAEISQYMPTLMSLCDDYGNLLGVLGLRSAKESELFLEQYLDRPVEQILASKINMPVSRDGLIEVGNLATLSAGGGRWLITALTSYLFAARSKWVVFTIGPTLHNSFKRMGLELIDLGPAELEMLAPEERAAWGSYYEQRPRVMAGRVADGYHIMRQQYAANSALTRLWLHAGRVGGLAA